MKFWSWLLNLKQNLKSKVNLKAVVANLDFSLVCGPGFISDTSYIGLQKHPEKHAENPLNSIQNEFWPLIWMRSPKVNASKDKWSWTSGKESNPVRLWPKVVGLMFAPVWIVGDLLIQSDDLLTCPPKPRRVRKDTEPVLWLREINPYYIHML